MVGLLGGAFGGYRKDDGEGGTGDLDFRGGFSKIGVL